MASFFEKLKKGMGVEIAEEEPEKMEEELREKPKPSPKKKRVKKIEVETDLINYPNRNAAKGEKERTFFEWKRERKNC
jgi:SepF-like predicted cell division protein (DUF552 family)